VQKGSLVSLRSLPIEGGKSVLISDCDEETQEAWKDPGVVVKGPYEYSSRQEFADGSKMTRVYRAVDIMHKSILYVGISIEHLDRIG
jgi:hypothetical protein